jgi:kynurenine formamidase
MSADEDLSNWGRWGAEDERGTLNLVTPQAIVDACGLVRRGTVYPLAIPMEPRLSSPLRDGMIHGVTVRHDPGPARRQVAIDILALDSHNFTHVDSLAHVAYGGCLYNGVPCDIVGSRGTSRFAIDRVTLVARGVLADVARARGLTRLAAGDVVEPEDLDRALLQARVEVRPGDVLLVRTGWIAQYLERPDSARGGWPGLGARALRWLADRGVCAVGADNPAVEARPPDRADRPAEFHDRFLRDLGGYLLEFLDLEQPARDGVAEGLFVTAPLRIAGGVGSPVTPLLIV